MDVSRQPQPVRRLNSNENPFLPGGELDKETDDLLKRATIIRDQFLLDDEAKRRLLDQQSSPPGDSNVVQEGQITPAHTSPVARSKENGQSGEPSSPGSARADSTKDASGSPESPGSPQTRSAVPKDKKKGNKCCSIM